MLPERKSCRNFYKKLRDNMTQELVKTKSRAICNRVLAGGEYKNAKTIFAYYPLGNEVNCLPVIEQALKDGKRIVLPRTSCDYQMDFYEVKSFDDLEMGHFHVMEPKHCCKLFLPQQENDVQINDENNDKMLALVPGVVFDRFGNRYGYGKGYYDRYFARFPQIVRMALGYTEQLATEPLDCLETDVKMQILVTEEEMIHV